MNMLVEMTNKYANKCLINMLLEMSNKYPNNNV